MKSSWSRVLFLFSLLISFSLPANAGDLKTVILENGNEIEIEKYPSDGNSLLLWFPSDHGLTGGLKDLASNLARLGVEVWIADPFSTWFLPTTTGSLEKIDQTDYLHLISKATATNKYITLASNDRGTSVLLETARKWQLKNSDKSLTGSIIISPNLYIETPGSGQEAQYLPVAHATNLNLLLIVPKKSTGFLRIQELQRVLTAGGSTVYVQPVPESRDRFFFREDATETEQEATSGLAGNIKTGIHLLESTPEPVKAVVSQLPATIKKAAMPTTGNLLPFKGKWKAPLFSLNDLSGTTHTFEQYSGSVVLVNFWASWCPPCIHEIPSMTRLQESFENRKLEILAINLGEPAGDIEAFLQQHPVNFTILLDPGQTQPKQWKVFAFPTSYLLDKNGRIRYSIAGGIDWNSIEVKQKITELLDE